MTGEPDVGEIRDGTFRYNPRGGETAHWMERWNFSLDSKRAYSIGYLGFFDNVHIRKCP